MPEHLFQKIAKFLRHTANILNLRDWHFILSAIPLTDNDNGDRTSAARIIITYCQDRATVQLCHDFAKLSAEERTFTIVHELLHCHFEPIMQVVSHDLQDVLSGEGYSIIQKTMLRCVETAVDRVATAYAERLNPIK